ncbi:MAG: tripartite tricarboxylate transporter substrate binding protein [Xanthobacteraceae bacterium]
MMIAPAVMLAVLSLPGQAADWPVRPVTVVVPLAAGGNSDMMARLAAQHLTDKLGQTFIVENRPSAGGAIATAQVAAAPPDGYTLLFTPSSMLLLTPLLQKLSFDPGKQLVPVTNVGTGAQVIAIKRELPARTLPEFLAYARGHPGTLNFAVAGTQNISHLAPVLLFARAGVNLVMVPAKGEAQAIADLISGQVDLYFGNASQLLPHAGSDRIRLLAVGTTQRIAAAPDLPTVAETFPGLVFSSWNGFVVPAGTPDEIVDAIRREIIALARSPEVAQRLTKLGIVPGGQSKEEVAATFASDREMFVAAVKAAGIASP